MRADTAKAREILMSGGHTCVFCRGDEIISSDEKGLRPLLARLDSRESLHGLCAADKVVGKAPAMLYALLDVTEVYAPVMSREAARVFDERGIAHECDLLTDGIFNADKSDSCPMELAVRDAETPEDGLRQIKAAIADMRRNRKN